jgi:hypothetical protein
VGAFDSEGVANSQFGTAESGTVLQFARLRFAERLEGFALVALGDPGSGSMNGDVQMSWMEKP